MGCVRSERRKTNIYGQVMTTIFSNKEYRLFLGMVGNVFDTNMQEAEVGGPR